MCVCAPEKGAQLYCRISRRVASVEIYGKRSVMFAPCNSRPRTPTPSKAHFTDETSSTSPNSSHKKTKRLPQSDRHGLEVLHKNQNLRGPFSTIDLDRRKRSFMSDWTFELCKRCCLQPVVPSTEMSSEQGEKALLVYYGVAVLTMVLRRQCIPVQPRSAGRSVKTPPPPRSVSRHSNSTPTPTLTAASNCTVWFTYTRSTPV